MTYSNPYYNADFGDFFILLFSRFWLFLQGKLGLQDLASDEIQILVLCGVAASSALVGTFLILKRMTMLANSLSHTVLLGIVMAYLITRSTVTEADSHAQYSGALDMHAMLIAALLMGLITVYLTEFLTKKARLQEDASTGIVFTSLFALGLVALTLLTRNAHIGTEVVMGNVDALHVDDCQLVFGILCINVVLLVLFFKEFTLSTFDPLLCKALGISTMFFNYLLMTQVSATVIGAFRAVGVLMVLAFITGPALSARLLTHSLKKMLALGVFLGCLASAIGVALSRHLLSVYDTPLSTGGLVVCTIVLLYIAVAIAAPQQGLIARQVHRRGKIQRPEF